MTAEQTIGILAQGAEDWKKKKCNQPLEEINEFLSEEFDPKTHFSVQWGQEPILGS